MKVANVSGMVVLLLACGQLQIGTYVDAASGGEGGALPEDGDDAGRGVAGAGAGGRAVAGSDAGGRSAGRGGSSGAGSGSDSAAGAAQESDAGHGDTGSGGDGESGAGGGAGDDAGGTAGESDRSCRGLEGQCQGAPSCCAPSYVESETFTLGEGEFSVLAHVTLFYPDAFEVTAARFARFVAGYDAWIASGNPYTGAGEHPYIRGTGWDTEWPLPVSSAALEQAISSCVISTYGLREVTPDLPMNCVNWFEAFAFCIWDGKRLLTEAEWELVAKGGSLERAYPWGNEPEPDPEHAVFGRLGDGDSETWVPADFLPVGSRPSGVSVHGLRDLAGSVAEWVFDAEDPYTNPCIDCANLESVANPGSRMFRGGGYSSPASALSTTARNRTDAATRLDFVGIRCARSFVDQN